MNKSAHILTALLLLVPMVTLHAKGPELRYGAEWGAMLSYWQHYHYNYLTDAQARVDTQDSRYTSHPNGLVSVYAGVQTGRKWETDVCIGYMGIAPGRRVVPVTVRLNYFFSSVHKDGGFKMFCEGGPLITNHFQERLSWGLRAGAGRRMMLSDRLGLDLSLSVLQSFDHPESPIYDPSHRLYVPGERIRRANTAYRALCLSLSLNL